MHVLYSWGANSHGQLGQGNVREQCAVPHIVDSYKFKYHGHHSVIKIVGGAGHTFILEESGEVYGCGTNSCGQLGISGEEKLLTEFRLISTLKEHVITDIACGWDSTIALTQANVVLVWGSNKYLQLGLDDPSYHHIPQTLVCSIKLIAMGLRHLALVTNAGLLGTAGSNRKGQLNLFDPHGCPVKQSSLKIVEGLQNVVAVACGQNHTLLITGDWQLFGFGDNRYKQICANNPDQTIYYPQRIYLNDSVSRESNIFCGWTHSALMNKDGSVLLWGRNNYGQLTGSSLGPVVLNDIKSISIGSEHCFCVDIDNVLYAWGWNEHNNCGIQGPEIITKQTVLASNCMLIGCGYGYGFAILIQ